MSSDLDLACLGAPLELKFAAEAPAGTFEGYGAVFGNIDSHGDVIEPGAFAKSLLERERQGRALPPMYLLHNKAGLGLPIGVWEKMSEDAVGLYVKGRLLNLDTDSGRTVYGLMKECALKGLSIGYRVPPGGSKMGSGRVGEPRRYLKSIHLSEVSLVDDPSNAAAGVMSVKAAAALRRPIATTRDFEAFLRDEGGFSKNAAKSIASTGFRGALDRPDDGDADTKALLDGLRAATKRIATLA